MGRSRDIAAILGKTEINNPSNERLLFTPGDTISVDSDYVNNQVIAAGGLAFYNTLDSLPVSGLTAGDQAFVSSNDRLYISNGSGWYGIGLIDSS